MRSLREVAEFLGIKLKFPRNDRSFIEAVASTCSGVDAASFRVVLRFRRNDIDFPWHVTESVVAGARGNPPAKGEQQTAYRIIDLVAYAATVLRGNPCADRKSLVALFEKVLRYPESPSPSHFTRIRRMACVDIFGRSDENVTLMPEIKRPLEYLGHSFSYSTTSSRQMRAVIIACAPEEHARLKKIAFDVPVAKRTAAVREAMRGWLDETNGADSPKQMWEGKTKDLLAAVSNPSVRYVDCAELSLNHSLEVGEKFLDFFQVDACAGRVCLSQFTLFIGIGFTINMQIVPLCYIWKCCNESTASWTHFLDYLESKHPFVKGNVTFCSDGHKGLGAAMKAVLPNVKEFKCIHHQNINLALFGANAISLYEAAFEAVPDSVQYLAACVADGGITYGRTASQAVESQNAHIADTRSLDLPNSALWVTQLEERRFEIAQAACLERTDAMPPKIRAKFRDLKAYGQVTDLFNNAPLLEAAELRFIVKTAPTIRRRVTLCLEKDANGGVVSYYGTCSCGIPS